MKAISSTASPSLLTGSWQIKGRSVPKRAVFPLILLVVALIGLMSPLFDLHQIHGFPGMKLFSQHLFFDGIADAGGFYASTFCKHWYHRLPIAVGFALGSTFLLVTLVG
jgi:hypothetical protein